MIIPIKPWLEHFEEPFATRVGPRPSGLVLSSSPELDEIRESSRSLSFETSNPVMNDRIEFYHEPILGAEILEAMEPIEGKQIFDGTLGGGGHAELFLENGAHVIGGDQDGAALSHATKRLDRFGDRFLPVRGNFESMDDLLHGVGVDRVDGVLLDLGVSSRQLDDATRGFSFREEAPLDMRMDDRSGLTARDVVNEWDEEDLVRIFREFGEEKRAVRVARAIVDARASQPIETTFGLAEIVSSVVPKVDRKHPATRVFQAVRIAVNRELEVLETALDKSVSLLNSGGVLAVISFHSLEDRIVKRFLRRRSEAFLDRPEWPGPRPNPEHSLTLPSRKAIVPGREEQERNPRSRSARLRIAVKL